MEIETDAVNNLVTTISNTSTSNDVEKYTSLVDTYGATATIIGVFIFILIGILVYMMKMMKKNNDQIMRQQEELLKKAMTTVKASPHKEKNIMDNFIKIDGSLSDVLYDIKSKTESDRVSIYVFHNGVYSSHGLPFFKTSCVSEVIKKGSGINRKAKTQYGMPLSIFDRSIKDIYRDGYVTIENVNDVKIDYPVIYNILNNSNIMSGVAIAIYDKDNNMLGILISEFVKTKTEEETEEVKDVLLEEAAKISPLLEYSSQDTES